MEKQIIKGEKIIISRLNGPSQHLIFELLYTRDKKYSYDIDIFAFMMDESAGIFNNAIIFYNNPSFDNDVVRYKEVCESAKISKSLEIDIERLPKEIFTISLVLSVYCKNRSKATKPQLVNFDLKVINKTQGSTMFISNDAIDCVDCQSFILGELYKYQNTWKYNAVKQEMDDALMNVMRKMYQINIY